MKKINAQIIAAVLIGALAGSMVMFVLGTPYKTTGNPNQFPLLNPAAIINDDYDYVVRFAPLRKSLNETYTDHPLFTTSVYFEYLPTGSNISVNKDLKMWPASLIKVPIAMAAAKKIERGEWTLDNKLVLLEEDKDTTFGDLYKQPAGTPITIRDLLHLTLVESDNTAHFILLRNLDSDEVEEVFIHLGLEEVVDDLKSNPDAETIDNRLTAKNYSIFFRALFNATFLNAELSNLLLDMMGETGSEYLGLAIVSTTPFAHKTGVRLEDFVWADSGIVYVDRRPYLITVMIEQKDKNRTPDISQAEALFEALSKETYEYVVGL